MLGGVRIDGHPADGVLGERGGRGGVGLTMLMIAMPCTAAGSAGMGIVVHGVHLLVRSLLKAP
jgi:hypothetical protein